MSQIGNAVSEKSIPQTIGGQPQVWDCHAGEKYPAGCLCGVPDHTPV